MPGVFCVYSNLQKEGDLMSNQCLNNVVDLWTVNQEKNKLIQLFWSENPIFHQILQTSHNLEEAREKVFNYLLDFEKKNLQPRHYQHPLDHTTAIKAIAVLKNTFSLRSEELSGFSALDTLHRQAQGKDPTAGLAFWAEFRHLFLAMKCNTGLYQTDPHAGKPNPEQSRAEATKRSWALDNLAYRNRNLMGRYLTGLNPEIARRRTKNAHRIQKILGGTGQEWQDWRWQCRNVIRDEATLKRLVELSPAESQAIKKAKELGIPFGITPYYVSLMDYPAGNPWDRAVRAQVIPPLSYVEGVARAQADASSTMDYMGERWTSPVDLVTRRYPNIAIFKPFNTCAQICVYCQRNWEINDVLAANALASSAARQRALQWFADHPEVTEILITGGDPLVMSDKLIKEILDVLAGIEHIKRIRIGTRTPVVLPMRITENLARLLGCYHEPGVREVAVMTHFQHPYEVTPEAREAVQRLRKQSIAVYNQAVFTSQNCRRFELVALRQNLRLIGVDPYYTFNAKGKEECVDYRVPIARLCQEQAEEARLAPGLDRTDEAVFNIPRLGKNYLRNGHDHDVIMIMADGSRLYEFFPWDRLSRESKPYLHIDTPILDFLEKLRQQGEDPEDYESIWYYY